MAEPSVQRGAVFAVGLLLSVSCSPATGSPAPVTGGLAALTEPAAQSAPAPSPAAALEFAWSTRAHLPQANSETAVAELNGRIYAVGGYPSTRVVSAAVLVYDVAADTWAVAAAPLPVPLHHAMAAGASGKLYVIGGETAGSGATQGPVPPGGPGFVNSLFQYDPAIRNWERRAPMPTSRSGGAAAVVDGKIYVVGGRPPGGHDFAVYDPASDRWTALPNLPRQRNPWRPGPSEARCMLREAVSAAASGAR